MSPTTVWKGIFTSTARSTSSRAICGLVRNCGFALPPSKWCAGVQGSSSRRVVDLLVYPQARDRNDTVVYLSEPTKMLLADVRRRCAVAGLVHSLGHQSH